MDDIQQRIVELESELQKAIQQVSQWNEVRLRTEGALAMLKELAKPNEDAKAVGTT